MRIAKRYDRKGIVYNRNDEPVSVITMMGVNHTPSSSFNLFSVSHCLRKGWALHGDFSGFTLTRGSSTIVFDIRIKSGSGYLWAAKLFPVRTPKGLWILLIRHVKRMMKVGNMIPRPLIQMTTFMKKSRPHHAIKYSKMRQLSPSTQLVDPSVMA